MKIYVISLAGQTGRRERISRSLQSGPLDFEFVDAVLGVDLLALEQSLGVRRKLFSARIGRRMTPGEIGCSLSHKKVLERFLGTDASWCLILEDDAAVTSGQLEALRDLQASLPAVNGVEIVKLGGISGATRTARGQFAGQGRGWVLVETVTFGSCTHGYIVSRDGAAKLAATIEPITEPYDCFLRSVHRHRCSVFETSPWLVDLQDDFLATSTIEMDRGREEIALKASDLLAHRANVFGYNISRKLWGLRRFGPRFLWQRWAMQDYPVR